MHSRPSHYVSGIVAVSLLLLLSIVTPHELPANPTLTLSSPAFINGHSIPQRYTCSGENKSPALRWSGGPAGTISFALIVADPDAPMGTFVHWVIYNLPASRTGLPEGVPSSPRAEGAQQGSNGSGSIGYFGPCPPAGKPHHYHFRLYALDDQLQLPPGATAEQVEAAMKNHIRASTQLIGIFAR